MSVDGALLGNGAPAKRKAAWQDEGNSDDSALADAAGPPCKMARTGLAPKRPALSAPLPLPDAAARRIMTRPRCGERAAYDAPEAAAEHELVCRPPPKPPKAVVAAPVLSVAEHAAAGKFFHARTALVLHPSELEDASNDSDDDVDEQYWEVSRVHAAQVLWRLLTHVTCVGCRLNAGEASTSLETSPRRV